MEVTFDVTRFKDCSRPHTDAEREDLRKQIAAHGGCRDPLVLAVLDGEPYLIDGFNRYAICKELGFRTDNTALIESLKTEAEIREWIAQNARARRNLTPTDKKHEIGQKYNATKMTRGGDRKSNSQNGNLIGATWERVADEHHVTKRDVMNAGKFAAAFDDAMDKGFDFLRWGILTEKVEVSDNTLKDLVAKGAESCRAPIEALIAKSEKGKVANAAVRKAAGLDSPKPAKKGTKQSPPAKESSPIPPGADEPVFTGVQSRLVKSDTVDAAGQLANLYVSLASVESDMDKLSKILAGAESLTASVRRILEMKGRSA